jgi:hypothetical protein
MADQTQPWAERTVDLSPQPELQPFQRGVAQVGPRGPAPTPQYEPTNSWPEQAPEPQRIPPGYHARQLRIGSGWSVFGALFAFVCWGIWVLSQGGDLVSPALTFVLTLAVGAGLFALTRLVGRVVLERQLGRIRRSAKGAHLVAGVFLFGVGVAYLRQTEWVMDVWNWVRGLF